MLALGCLQGVPLPLIRHRARLRYHDLQQNRNNSDVRCGVRRNSEVKASSSEEPDWDAEMDTFRRRTLAPNQLETLRKAEEQDIDVGQVLFVSEGLAIVEGLNNDAPVGTTLAFGSGSRGVLLWRRSDNICFALLLGDAADVQVGEEAECKIKGILQVVDSKEGPATKRDYEEAAVPAGEALRGQVVDWLGRRFGETEPIGEEARVPLFNAQLDMDSREQIAEALTTGVRALDFQECLAEALTAEKGDILLCHESHLSSEGMWKHGTGTECRCEGEGEGEAMDILTPLGRGQAQLVVGPPGCGKTLVVTDAILGQAGAGVRCFYASVSHSASQQQRALSILRTGGAMDYTTVVAAPEGATLGQQYGTLCSAISMAERVRDEGGHTLVVLDDASCMTAIWDSITRALAQLGPSVLALTEEEEQTLAEASEEEMVDYEGTLISASAAQRRRFFSSLVQRAAKVHRRRGGGSLTLLLVLPGQPASGLTAGRRPPAAGYKHLSPEQRAKLEAALAAREASGEGAAAADIAAGILRTEVVEEFMSIADGQAVLRGEGDPAARGISLDARTSVSRIGARAFPAALQPLAPAIRLELAQAADTDRFAADRQAGAIQAELRRAAVVEAALIQPASQPTSLVTEVIEVVGLAAGLLDEVAPAAVRGVLSEAVAEVKRSLPQVVDAIAGGQPLPEEARAAVADVFRQLVASEAL